ncbi:hypothetical protein ID866_9142 [Astraeus odoratus]|nr:hypothetical protein ID866_9142 [Astraeus odoratus]
MVLEYVALAVNKSYLRKKTLLRLVNLDLKQEIAGAGISKYLMDEFHSAQTNLHDIPDTRPESLYASHRPLPSRIISQLCPQAVMLYAATVALFSPSKISLAQLAVIEQTNVTLRQTLSSFSFFASRLPQEVAKLGSFYRTLDAKAEMVDGDTPYPRKGYDTSSGMSIEFRNVSFGYPSTKSGRSALSNVSFTIQPGQLVVIVGCNGSGKTTIIKLLSRFYDVDGGTILIDGIPIQEYRMAELRKGISMLSQEHRLFPLTVEENIAIGSPDPAAMQDTGKLKESMKLAGAEKIVDNFTDGMKTVLRPISEEYMSFSAYGNSTLEDIYNSCSKWKDISGGEKQRLVAARTFMRLLSTPVKLVAVDEPSSALDPADLILCVKDGVLVETGTHSELLAVNGEYAHLYNVQAQAFSPKPV